MACERTDWFRRWFSLIYNLNQGSFEELGKKEAYTLCVKVLHSRSFEGMKRSFFGPAQPVKGCWRSLYKMPIDKRTGDLQWRIVHGAIATNKHVAHLDSTQGKECPFCIQDETWCICFVVVVDWGCYAIC